MSGIEWQVAEGSSTLHLIEAEQPRKRSGARAACGRYPQRGRSAWFALSPHEDVVSAARIYELTFCNDCLDRADDVSADA